MENTTMTKGTVLMSTSQTRFRIERSLSARLLAPVTGQVWGTTPSAAVHADARLRATGAIPCGDLAGLAFGYAPSATDRMITIPVTTTLTTPFMDVDDLRSGRPPV